MGVTQGEAKAASAVDVYVGCISSRCTYTSTADAAFASPCVTPLPAIYICIYIYIYIYSRCGGGGGCACDGVSTPCIVWQDSCYLFIYLFIIVCLQVWWRGGMVHAMA